MEYNPNWGDFFEVIIIGFIFLLLLSCIVTMAVKKRFIVFTNSPIRNVIVIFIWAFPALITGAILSHLFEYSNEYADCFVPLGGIFACVFTGGGIVWWKFRLPETNKKGE